MSKKEYNQYLKNYKKPKPQKTMTYNEWKSSQHDNGTLSLIISQLFFLLTIKLMFFPDVNALYYIALTEITGPYELIIFTSFMISITLMYSTIKKLSIK